MNHISKKSSHVALAILSVTLVIGPALAQSVREGQRQEHEAPPREVTKVVPKLVPHDTLVGAAVDNGLTGELRKTLGSIADLVIDTAGTVRYAIVENGKRQSAILWGLLSWDAKASRFSLMMEPDELARMPVFDLTKLASLVGTGTVDAHDANGAMPAKVAAPALSLASRLAGCAVMAQAQELGSGDTIFIEPRSGTAVFLCVSAGGVLGIGKTRYVVPWAALHVVDPSGKAAPRARIARAKADLEDAAPKLGDAGADVDSGEFRQKVYEFYQVDRPAFEPAKDASEKVGRLQYDRDG